MDNFEYGSTLSELDSQEYMLDPLHILHGDSFSSVYFPLESSDTLQYSQRRQSFGSLKSSLGLEFFSSPSVGTKSPSTPMTSNPLSTVCCGSYLKSTEPEFSLQYVNSFSSEDCADEDALWMTDSPKAANPSDMYYHFTDLDSSALNHDFPSNHSQPWYQVLSQTTMNPALSLPIFDEPLPEVPVASHHQDLFCWTPRIAQSPPRTVAPSATIHPLCASSPTSADVPVTPIGSIARSSVTFGGSPMANYSPGFLPSQPEVDDSPLSAVRSSIELTPGDIARIGRPVSLLTRRQYARKGPSGSSRTSRTKPSKSGFNCEEVIPQNEFACKYKDCIDKDTGKQKRFKRQEHKKRHEKTVHEKDRYKQYSCWVPDCKTAPFSRTDNLKSHLQKTHGKKSPNARNRYVASQDKNSEFYDPEWVGDLTDEGFPICDDVASRQIRNRHGL